MDLNHGQFGENGHVRCAVLRGFTGGLLYSNQSGLRLGIKAERLRGTFSTKGTRTRTRGVAVDRYEDRELPDDRLPVQRFADSEAIRHIYLLMTSVIR
jgi:hypothetical protein